MISLPEMPMCDGIHIRCIVMCACVQVCASCLMLLAICDVLIVSLSESRLILFIVSYLLGFSYNEDTSLFNDKLIDVCSIFFWSFYWLHVFV